MERWIPTYSTNATCRALVTAAPRPRRGGETVRDCLRKLRAVLRVFFAFENRLKLSHRFEHPTQLDAFEKQVKSILVASLYLSLAKTVATEARTYQQYGTMTPLPQYGNKNSITTQYVLGQILFAAESRG